MRIAYSLNLFVLHIVMVIISKNFASSPFVRSINFLNLHISSLDENMFFIKLEHSPLMRMAYSLNLFVLHIVMVAISRNFAYSPFVITMNFLDLHALPLGRMANNR